MEFQALESPVSHESNPPFQDFFARAPPENPPDSDCESTVSYSATSGHPKVVFSDDLAVELSEGDRVHELIRRRFISCLGPLGQRTKVVAIHRKNWTGFSNQARLKSFHIHSEAMDKKHGGGCSNVKFAWYGNGRERIEEILSRGFGFREILDNSHRAIILSADNSPADSIEKSVADEDGTMHVLLCRVKLGRPELLQVGSSQSHPSSDEFDSGVDRFENPKKYIIWSTHMNSHILPEYVISFRTSELSSLRESPRIEEEKRFPTSPWIPFPVLVSVLGRFLHEDAMRLINKYYKEFNEKRMTRKELIQKVRPVAGDELLISIIKSCRGAMGKRKINKGKV